MSTFVPGMRVIVTNSPEWEQNCGEHGKRIPGHYGKVIEVRDECYDGHIHVQITGHIDGDPPNDLSEIEWYWPEELTVVD